MKTIYILLLIIFSIEASSQNYVRALTSFANEKKISEIKSQKTKGKYQLFIYQTISCSSKIYSILIIKKNLVSNYWIILNDSITKHGTLNNDSIFLYKNYLKTGVTKYEDKLQFTPPLICCKIAIYEDNKIRFYFEDEKVPNTYIANEKSKIYRDEWIRIIKKDLTPLLKTLE